MYNLQGTNLSTEDTIMSDSSASLSRYYGTEFYRSPEVRKKHHRSKIDWRKTDIYASGVIFFELCHIIPRQDRDKVLLPLTYYDSTVTILYF